MLLYNKSLIGAPPETTDELITVGKQLTGGDRYGIVWNQVEPFWLVPWLGGFGGEVFAEDGLTPNLNTPPMVATLQFLSDLKNVHGITPQEVDYAGADSLFKDGQAAMIVNGDWALSEYVGILGDDLGIAPLPKVASTGLFPAPYTSGKYFMIPVDVEGQRRDTIVEFIEYVTNYDNQIRLVTELTRLPALREALDDPLVTGDPILEGSSLQIAQGTPMPSVLEWRCNWDAMKPELIAVLTSTKNASGCGARHAGVGRIVRGGICKRRAGASTLCDSFLSAEPGVPAASYTESERPAPRYHGQPALRDPFAPMAIII